MSHRGFFRIKIRAQTSTFFYLQIILSTWCIREKNVLRYAYMLKISTVLQSCIDTALNVLLSIKPVYFIGIQISLFRQSGVFKINCTLAPPTINYFQGGVLQVGSIKNGKIKFLAEHRKNMYRTHLNESRGS